MTSAATREPATLRRTDYPVLRSLPTRWADVDVYGHVNNAVHYELMDTAVNGWLIEATGTDIRTLDAVGWVVETSCRYLAQLHFPAVVDVGLAVERVGSSSVIYRPVLFGDGEAPAALGRFVHVYVERATERPTPVPDAIRAVLETLPADPLSS